jgi:Tfp pilus assembly protein PilZ
VRFSDDRALQQCFVNDIGHGGIFLRAQKLQPVRSAIAVLMTLPDGKELKLRGEVVHVRTPEEATPQLPAGMGIQFLDMTAEITETLKSYVDRLAKRATLVPQAAPAAPKAPAPAQAPKAAPPPGPKAAAEPPPRDWDADIEVLRRLCWLVAEGSLLGRPYQEVFGVASVSLTERRARFQHIREVLQESKPPPYLGPEEARAVHRLLAELEPSVLDD